MSIAVAIAVAIRYRMQVIALTKNAEKQMSLGATNSDRTST